MIDAEHFSALSIAFGNIAIRALVEEVFPKKRLVLLVVAIRARSRVAADESRHLPNVAFQLEDVVFKTVQTGIEPARPRSFSRPVELICFRSLHLRKSVLQCVQAGQFWTGQRPKVLFGDQREAFGEQ